MNYITPLDYQIISDSFYLFVNNSDEKVVLAKLLKDIFDESMTVLDIGAGTGELSKRLGRKNKKIIVIEPQDKYQTQLAEALRDSDHQIISQKIEEVSLSKIHFDSFIFSHSLSYIQDYPSVIDNLCDRIIKNGVGVFITLSSSQGDQARIMRKFWHKYHPDRPLISPSSDEIVGCLRSIGQKPIKKSVVSHTHVKSYMDALAILGFFLEIDSSKLSVDDLEELLNYMKKFDDNANGYKFSTCHEVVYFKKG